MTNYLVISVLGDDRQGLVEKISNTVLDYECNIENSRVSVLGATFAMMLLVRGRWNNLAKLETALAALEKQLELTITARRTEARKPDSQCMPYSVDVVALDHPGILTQLSSFFATRKINIHEMVASIYTSVHTGTPMASIHLDIDVPARIHIAALREEFLDLCDERNLDGVLEPLKI